MAVPLAEHRLRPMRELRKYRRRLQRRDPLPAEAGAESHSQNDRRTTASGGVVRAPMSPVPRLS
jgi:hypothetical protein